MPMFFGFRRDLGLTSLSFAGRGKGGDTIPSLLRERMIFRNGMCTIDCNIYQNES